MEDGRKRKRKDDTEKTPKKEKQHHKKAKDKKEKKEKKERKQLREGGHDEEGSGSAPGPSVAEVPKYADAEMALRCLPERFKVFNEAALPEDPRDRHDALAALAAIVVGLADQDVKHVVKALQVSFLERKQREKAEAEPKRTAVRGRPLLFDPKQAKPAAPPPPPRVVPAEEKKQIEEWLPKTKATAAAASGPEPKAHVAVVKHPPSRPSQPEPKAHVAVVKHPPSRPSQPEPKAHVAVVKHPPSRPSQPQPKTHVAVVKQPPSQPSQPVVEEADEEEESSTTSTEEAPQDKEEARAAAKRQRKADAEAADKIFDICKAQQTVRPVARDDKLQEDTLRQYLTDVLAAATQPEHWHEAWLQMLLPDELRKEAGRFCVVHFLDLAKLPSADPTADVAGPLALALAYLVRGLRIKTSTLQEAFLERLMPGEKEAWDLLSRVLFHLFPMKKSAGWGWWRVGWSFTEWWKITDKILVAAAERNADHDAFEALKSALERMQAKSGSKFFRRDPWNPSRREQILSRLHALLHTGMSEAQMKVKLAPLKLWPAKG
eukprot:TRINITY_DN5441_c0_g1_i1.p1 TRINITY_DN5441_c0_g1~~TRINITY_DN5441_c0_g1_i1.p1  ORF type:complete len:547 (+),score=154.59 TRINITY_DN5441_c0_g1_i1:105-1745(+)